MDALLRKYLWMVDLVVVGLCAVFLARATASVVESKLLEVTPLPRPAPRAAAPQQQTVYSKAVEPIVKRNLFCSTCKPPDAGPGPEPEKDLPVTEEKTSLPLQLLVVNYAPGGAMENFRWATAILRDNDTRFVGAYGVGEKVKGAIITEIKPTRIHLDNNGKPEFLDLLDENTATTPPNPDRNANNQPPPAPPPASSGGDAFSQELDRGIKKNGENSYTIQRSTLESVLGNMSLLSRSARIVPEIRDGKAAGFRLYSVRPDGPFAKIGMQNGDVISSINGLEITSPEKALEVYAKLKSASHLSLGLERNGQRTTKEYSIR